MIDGFGHNGGTCDRAFGVVGVAGMLQCLVDERRQLIVAMYAEPEIGKLHHCVPLPARLWPAANDYRNVPNDGDTPGRR